MEISGKEIEALAKAIGTNSKLDTLGLNLHFNLDYMSMCKATNFSGPMVTCNGTKAMLKDFCEKTSLKKQRPLLKKALKDAGLLSFAELYLTDSTSQAASSSSGQAAVSETERVLGRQPTQSRHSVSNKINASGGQANVSNSTPSAPVVSQKRSANTSPNPPAKRQKVTHSGSSPSKGVPPKQKKTSAKRQTPKSFKNTSKAKTGKSRSKKKAKK